VIVLTSVLLKAVMGFQVIIIALKVRLERSAAAAVYTATKVSLLPFTAISRKGAVGFSLDLVAGFIINADAQ
jgi:hypothetical protein